MKLARNHKANIAADWKTETELAEIQFSLFNSRHPQADNPIKFWSYSICRLNFILFSCRLPFIACFAAFIHLSKLGWLIHSGKSLIHSLPSFLVTFSSSYAASINQAKSIKFNWNQLRHWLKFHLFELIWLINLIEPH